MPRTVITFGTFDLFHFGHRLTLFYDVGTKRPLPFIVNFIIVDYDQSSPESIFVVEQELLFVDRTKWIIVLVDHIGSGLLFLSVVVIRSDGPD